MFLLRRSTWVALLVLVIVVGVLLYLNRQKQTVKEMAQSFPTLPSRTVFGDLEGAVNRIQIQSASGKTVEMALNMQGDWDIILPIEGVAGGGVMEGAISQLDTMRFTSEIQDLALADIGLDQPQYILTLRLKAGGKRVIEVGDKTPSQTGYYIRLDGTRLLVVEADAIDSLLIMFEQPPYWETPTPSPTPLGAYPEPGTAVSTESVTPAP
jgi:hypothetical protein